MILITLLGGLLAKLNDQSLRSGHYAEYPKVMSYLGTVSSDFTERPKYWRYDFELCSVADSNGVHTVTGKIFLYIKKDSAIRAPYHYGDILAVSGSYFEVSAPKNPNEFNYKNYLKLQNIYAHAFTDGSKIKFIGEHTPNPFWSLAYEIRESSREIIQAHVKAGREQAILIALLIGVKDYLDDDVQKAYSSAGAMHVLAVSGLHVGILYSLLLILFKRWKDLRAGKIAFLLTSICVIWIYALVTGFSPSVMRAVTMFTIIIISGAFHRKANIFNTLGIAAIVLILYDPNMIYSVGFQLSFAAVIGIVIFQPRLERMMHFRYQWINYLWSITCVSVAAQLATFPLTLYYFHQFPTYFLVSNLVVIPAAVVMLMGGMIMLAAGAVWPLLGAGIGFLLEHFVWLINELIAMIQFLPYPIFDWLYFDLWEVWLVYAAILFLAIGLMSYSFRRVATGLTSLIVLFCWIGYRDYQLQNVRKLIFYELDGKMAIDFIDGHDALLLLDDSEFGEVEAFQIDPNRIAMGLDPAMKSKLVISDASNVTQTDAWSLLQWKDVKIAIARDHPRGLIRESFEADLVYLDQASKLRNLTFDTKILLLGSEFRKFEIARIREKYSRMDMTIHSLGEDGYFELELNANNEISN